MYKHILVPISFDDDRDAAGALNAAQTLADKDGQITLLHVIEQIPPYVASQIPQDIMEANLKTSEVALAELATPIANAKSSVIHGHSSRAILDWAADHKPDCIVIASHRPGMQDLLLGSTAAKVVRHAACSVHVVR